MKYKITSNTIAVILVVAVLAVVGGIELTKKDDKEESGKKLVTANEEASGRHEGGHGKGASEDDSLVVDLTGQETVSMDIKDFAYSKPNIRIKKGTTVTWTNQDTVKHNVMLEHAGGGAAHDAPSPSEVKSDVFAGPLLAKGESYSFTFNEAGADPYHCSPHPDMKGTITVVE